MCSLSNTTKAYLHPPQNPSLILGAFRYLTTSTINFDKQRIQSIVMATFNHCCHPVCAVESIACLLEIVWRQKIQYKWIALGVVSTPQDVAVMLDELVRHEKGF